MCSPSTEIRVPEMNISCERQPKAAPPSVQQAWQHAGSLGLLGIRHQTWFRAIKTGKAQGPAYKLLRFRSTLIQSLVANGLLALPLSLSSPGCQER